MRLHYWIYGLFLLISCGKIPVAESVWERDQNEGWNISDTLTLTYGVTDTVARYDLVVSVEHDDNYQWQNLYVEMGNLTPRGDTLRAPVSLELADNRGRWQGACSGASCRAVIDLRTHFYFSQKGDYTIWMIPYMRTDTVEGLRSVALSLFHSEER